RITDELAEQRRKLEVRLGGEGARGRDRLVEAEERELVLRAVEGKRRAVTGESEDEESTRVLPREPERALGGEVPVARSLGDGFLDSGDGRHIPAHGSEESRRLRDA